MHRRYVIRTFLCDMRSRWSILLTQSTSTRISKSSQRKSTISRLYASGWPAKYSLTPFNISFFLTTNTVEWRHTWTAAGVMALGRPLGLDLGLYSMPNFSKLLLICLTLARLHFIVFATVICSVLWRRRCLAMSCWAWDSLGGIAFDFEWWAVT